MDIPDPEGSGELVKAAIIEADWNNGEVKLTHGGKFLSVDKHKVKKTEQPPSDTLNLGGLYDQPPGGSVALYKHAVSGNYLVMHPDGTKYIYSSIGGTTLSNVPMENYEAAPFWTKLEGAPEPIGVPQESLPDMTGLMDMGNPAYLVSPTDTPTGPSPYLGAGFAAPPKGAEVLAKHEHAGNFAVKHPDGVVHMYYPDGKVTESNVSLDKWNEQISPDKSWKPVPAKALLPGAKDANGDVIAKNDLATIIKYNKGGFSPSVMVVSINEEKGTARVRRLDENGLPLSKDGKPVYANISLGALVKKNSGQPQSEGLPKGITLSQGDPSSPLYGAAKPDIPVMPAFQKDDLELRTNFSDRLQKAYDAYRAKKNLTPKKMEESSTAGTPLKQAYQGDLAAVEKLKAKGYLDEDPKLYEELKDAIAKQKVKYDVLLAEHEANVLVYQQKQADWMAANGVASYTPLRHEDAKGMNTADAKTWARNRFKSFISKAKSAGLLKGISKQKGSSSWQTKIRLLPATLGLTRKDIASHPDVSASSMETWDNIKGLMDLVGPIGEDLRGIRTISYNRLVDNLGKQLDENSDLTQIIGTIQKDHGAMEINLGASYDHGGKSGYDNYPVKMDLAIPAEVKGWYTAMEGAGGESYMSEYGTILEPGLAMYISDAKKVNGYWRVKASIIPPSVLPYMNNFEGMPDQHNIAIPGKDTTTGVPQIPTPASPAPPAPSEPGDGEWTQGELDAAEMGKVVTDSEGTKWTKGDFGTWETEDGASAPSNNLADDYMTDQPVDLVGAGNFGITKDTVSISLLVSAPVGTVVVDDDGDHWKKNIDGDWLGLDGVLAGEVRESIDLLGYITGDTGV